jgi:hypothetical protein
MKESLSGTLSSINKLLRFITLMQIGLYTDAYVMCECMIHVVRKCACTHPFVVKLGLRVRV